MINNGTENITTKGLSLEKNTTFILDDFFIFLKIIWNELTIFIYKNDSNNDNNMCYKTKINLNTLYLNNNEFNTYDNLLNKYKLLTKAIKDNKISINLTGSRNYISFVLSEENKNFGKPVSFSLDEDKLPKKLIDIILVDKINLLQEKIKFDIKDNIYLYKSKEIKNSLDDLNKDNILKDNKINEVENFINTNLRCYKSIINKKIKSNHIEINKEIEIENINDYWFSKISKMNIENINLIRFNNTDNNDNNKITSLEPLLSHAFKNIEIIDLSQNLISNIDCLKNTEFNELKTIDFRWNKISNISVFKSMKMDKIENILLSFNPININIKKKKKQNQNKSTIKDLENRYKDIIIII